MEKKLKNKDILVKHETAHAYELSAAVFEKPQLSVWMILIPIIFVFHMYRHQRYVNGRKAFTENYLITRNRAIDAAYSSCLNDDTTDLTQFVTTSGVPDSTKGEFRGWIKMLIEHYQTLILANGNDFESLVRDAYKTKMNYLLVINSLNTAERRFSEALKPHIGADLQAVENTIDKIDHHTEIIRKQSAELIFS